MMIFYDMGDKYRVVAQPDHGVQCASFARSWGNEQFETPSPATPMTEAAGEHDGGWTEWEQHPTIDQRYGRPWQFYELEAEEHVPLYRRGIERSTKLGPYTGLMVSMHGVGLYNGRYGTFPGLKPKTFTPSHQAIVDEYLADQEALQRRLKDELRAKGEFDAAAEARVWHNYKLLQAWDRLSLWCCFQNLPTGTLGPVPTRLGADDAELALSSPRTLELTLDPYPFRDSRVTTPVRAREVPKREYRTPAEFREAYDRATPHTIEFVMCAK